MEIVEVKLTDTRKHQVQLYKPFHKSKWPSSKIINWLVRKDSIVNLRESAIAIEALPESLPKSIHRRKIKRIQFIEQQFTELATTITRK